MTERRDDLVERYADAATHDASRPSAHVRDAVHNHARMLAESRRTGAATATVVKPGHRPANQSKWTLSLIASVVMLGFTGLLVIQIDRGVPADHEVALGYPPQNNSVPAAVTAPAPAVSTLAKQTVVIAVAPNRTDTDTHMPSPQSLPARETTAARREVHQDAAGQVAGPVVNPQRPAPMAAPNERSRAPGARQPVTAFTVFFEAARIGEVATIDTWLNKGVPVNTRDGSGDTALMIAVANQQVAVVKKLLARGADPTLVNRNGKTALELARGLQRSDLVEMLHPTE